MMGWSIVIEQQTPEEWRRPDIAKNSIELAKWKATFGGMAWIEKLSKEGKASSLKGYPTIYVALASDVIPFISNHPPFHDDLPKIIGLYTSARGSIHPSSPSPR